MFKDKLIFAYQLFSMKIALKNEGWPKKQWILGHRGARSEAPENTLSAFMLAMKQGADGIEFDVSLSKDGQPVVIHDRKINRTAYGQGYVKDMDASELKKLNATKTIPSFEPEGVPSLKETLACLPEGSIANVELKFSGNFPKDFFIDAVIKDLKAEEKRLKLIISSFDGELLAKFRKKESHFLLSLILCPKDKHWPLSLRYLPAINPEGLHLSPQLFGPIIYRLIKRAKLKVGIWTINDPQMAKKLLAMGVDGIFTDYVERIIKSLKP